MTRISEAVECLESLGYTVTPPAAAINAGIQNGKNTWSLLMDALTPKSDPRADLVDLFERYADRGPDDQLYIDVETAADLVVDNDWQQVSAVEATKTVWHKDQFYVTIETDAEGLVTISDELLVKLMTESGWVLQS